MLWGVVQQRGLPWFLVFQEEKKRKVRLLAIHAGGAGGVVCLMCMFLCKDFVLSLVLHCIAFVMC